MIRHNILVSLCIGLHVISADAGQSDDFVTVDFYVVEKDAYDGSTPINSVLTVSPKAILAPIKCFSEISDSPYSEERVACPKQWANYVKQCSTEIRQAVLVRAKGIETEYKPKVFISRLLRNGNAALVVKNYYGGSGGAHEDWSLFMIEIDKKSGFSCPVVPFMSGIEVSPGGLGWESVTCKAESFDSCANRIFYPVQNGYRMVFGSTGTKLIPNPKRMKTPGYPLNE